MDVRVLPKSLRPQKCRRQEIQLIHWFRFEIQVEASTIQTIWPFPWTLRRVVGSRFEALRRHRSQHVQIGSQLPNPRARRSRTHSNW